MKRSFLIPLGLLLLGLAVVGGYVLFSPGDATPPPIQGATQVDANSELDSTAGNTSSLPMNSAQPELKPDTPDPAADSPEPEVDQPNPDPLEDIDPFEADEDEKPELPAAPPELTPEQLESINDDMDRLELPEDEKQAMLEAIKEAARTHHVLVEPNSMYFKGTVIDHEGAPIAGAAVYIQLVVGKPGEEGYLEYTPGEYRTDADGKFADWLSTYGEINVQARVYTENEFMLRSPVVELAVSSGRVYDGIELQLPRGAGITGNVLDLAKLPVAGATIVATSELIDKIGGFKTTSTEDGSFQLLGLPDGKYRIQVWCSGYAHVNQDKPWITITEGEPTPLPRDLVLKKVTAIKLKLMADGKPLTGRIFVFCDTDNDLTSTSDATCNSEGVAYVVPFWENTIAITVVMATYESSERIPVTIYPGAHTDVGTITLKRSPEKED